MNAPQRNPEGASATAPGLWGRARAFVTRGPWSYPRLNRDFTAVCFASPPLLGSFASFIFHGGGLWCVFSVLTGRRPLARDAHVMRMTAALWLLVFAYLASAAINGLGSGGALSILWLWTFLIFPFSYSIWSISEKPAIIDACVGASVVACYSAFAVALVQYGLMDERPEGGAGNAIVFATVTAYLGAVALIGAFRASGRPAAIRLGAFAASIVAVSLSGTRGIWMAILVNLVIVAFLYRKGIGRRSRGVNAIAIIGLVLVAWAFVWVMVPRFSDAIVDIESIASGDYDSSLGFRFAMWTEGARIWLERPLFGFGPGSVPELMRERINAVFGISIAFTHFHNAFITTLVEAGLFGLAGLLAVIAAPVSLALRALRGQPGENEKFGAALLLVLMSTFVTAGLSSIMIGHDILDTVFVMSLVLGSYLARGKPALRTSDLVERI